LCWRQIVGIEVEQLRCIDLKFAIIAGKFFAHWTTSASVRRIIDRSMDSQALAWACRCYQTRRSRCPSRLGRGRYVARAGPACGACPDVGEESAAAEFRHRWISPRIRSTFHCPGMTWISLARMPCRSPSIPVWPRIVTQHPPLNWSGDPHVDFSRRIFSGSTFATSTRIGTRADS